MPGVVVRRAAPEDAPVFLALVDALADYEKLDRPTPDARARLVRDGFGERQLFTPYLAELDGKPVAYAMTFFTYSSFLALPTLYMEDFFVLPEAREHGVGGAIFGYLAAEAVRAGCGRGVGDAQGQRERGDEVCWQAHGTTQRTREMRNVDSAHDKDSRVRPHSGTGPAMFAPTNRVHDTTRPASRRRRGAHRAVPDSRPASPPLAAPRRARHSSGCRAA